MENRHRKKGLLDRFMIWLLAVLQKSFIGRFLTSYDARNDRFLERGQRSRRNGERRFARLIERNRVINFVPKIAQFLLRLPLRDYGIMLFMTGAVVTGLYPINDMILFIDVTFEMFVMGVATSSCALPLLLSSRSLASNVLSSKFFSFLLFDCLGLDRDEFRVAAEKERISFATFAFLIGACLGVASYFILPVGTVAIILALSLAYSTVRTPEVGVIISVALIPFVSIYVTCGCAAFTFVCYVIKVLLGKRVFRFEYFDLWISIAIVAFFFCGINYTDPVSTIKDTLLTLVVMLSYFLFANLIYSKVWFRRSIVAFTTSSLVVAVVAVAQAILRTLSGSIDELEAVYSKNADIVSTMGSAEVLAQYMVIAIPFALVHMISEKKDSSKFVGFILAVLLVAALVLTYSAVGLVGLLVGALLIFAFFKRTAIYLIFAVLVALPILYFTLPDHIISAISVGPLAGASVKSEFIQLKGDFLTIIKHPMGANLNGGSVMEIYGTQGFESMPLQLLATHGVIGVASFLVMLLMFVRVTLSYSVKAKNMYRRVNGCAGLCSISALTIVGVFSNVWADKKIFLVYIITIALSLAYTKIDRQEEAVISGKIDITFATVDIPLKEAFAHAAPSPRRNMYSAKIKKQLKRQEKNRIPEVKEFSNTEELIISTKKYEEEQE